MTDAAPLRTHAFGLDVTASFEAPGLPPGAPATELPRVRLDLASEAEIDAAWDAARPERILEEEIGPGAPARTIDRDASAGYRLYARHFGLALIAAAGDRVLCAPPDDEPWSWQRFLVGRVLPWAAVVNGLEVLHASAVRIGDGAVGFVADTGVGKTSVALRLLLRGAGFVTDDVLALEPRAGAPPLVHPGAAILSVRGPELDALGADRDRLGRVLGTSVKTYIEIEREPAPLPLRALYFLSPRESGGTSIEPGGVTPGMLLGNTFVSSLDSPERLARLLDVSAAVAQSSALFRVAAGRDDDAALAAALHDHALGLVRT